VVRVVDGGRIDCMPKIDVAKLTGRKSMAIRVRMRMLLP
jgi:hypothetical protein